MEVESIRTFSARSTRVTALPGSPTPAHLHILVERSHSPASTLSQPHVSIDLKSLSFNRDKNVEPTTCRNQAVIFSTPTDKRCHISFHRDLLFSTWLLYLDRLRCYSNRGCVLKGGGFSPLALTLTPNAFKVTTFSFS